MTPRQNDVRLTSKLELGSIDTKVIKKQIDSIKENLKKYTIPSKLNEFNTHYLETKKQFAKHSITIEK